MKDPNQSSESAPDPYEGWSDSAKALNAMYNSYENMRPEGRAISREEILEERREIAEARVKYAHLLKKP